ncbi:hypothetical protein [Clostridium sp.]|uniref:hypothetical protein n=1 Tax=Clostridium sp. TaxID=1506 RepID=UPI0025BFA9AA|nr:hypothetical protein [Clostridium sp.]
MTQENKDLLLKDLCARLNTKLVCSIYRTDDQGIGYRNEILHGYCNIDAWNEFYFGEDCGISINDILKIKPYLFPMSSMTEEQEKEYNDLNCYELGWFPHTEKALDYLIKNHFDYRELIDEGLAIDATGLNIY